MQQKVLAVCSPVELHFCGCKAPALNYEGTPRESVRISRVNLKYI